MALLNFPANPNNGDLYPATPLVGQNQYQYEAATSTWRLLGPATGVTPNTYGDALNVSQFTVNAAGRITFAQNVPIQLGDTTQIGLVQLVDNTTSNDPTKALTAAQGYYLQNQIGDVNLLSPPAPNLVAAINAIGGTTGVTPGTYGNSLTVGQFTVDIYGKITNATDVAIATATSASPGVVTVGSNIQVAAGTISVNNASTAQSGVVQLNDTVTSTSTTQAATANALKTAYDLANAAVPKSSYTAKGDILGGTGAGTFTAPGLKWANLGFQNLDDVGGSFNGVTVSFPLTLGGVPYTPNPSSNIMVFLGGVPQVPGVGNAYTVTGSTLTFSNAPATGTSFYATTVY